MTSTKLVDTGESKEVNIKYGIQFDKQDLPVTTTTKYMTEIREKLLYAIKTT